MKKKIGASNFQWRVIAACSLFSAFSLGYIFGLLSQGWINDKPVRYSSTNPLFISLGTPYDFVRTYNDSSKTKQQHKAIQKFLVVAIISGLNNFMQRKYIRESWLTLLKHNGIKDMHHVFVIGNERVSMKDRLNLQVESKEFGDLLLLENVLDSYKNLTLKLLNGMKWFNENVDFSYLLKVDDDSFARIDKIYSVLKDRKSHSKFYWGYFDGRARVKHYGKWAEKNWVLCDRYLPYARGGGYVLSSDLVHFIAKNSDLLQLYNSEDVSIGTWLAPLKIDRVHGLEFDTEYESRGCLNSYLVTHKQTTQDMVRKYKNLMTSGEMCDPEIQHKNAYVYNWEVLPSLCCKSNGTKIIRN